MKPRTFPSDASYHLLPSEPDWVVAHYQERRRAELHAHEIELKQRIRSVREREAKLRSESKRNQKGGLVKDRRKKMVSERALSIILFNRVLTARLLSFPLSRKETLLTARSQILNSLQVISIHPMKVLAKVNLLVESKTKMMNILIFHQLSGLSWQNWTQVGNPIPTLWKKKSQRLLPRSSTFRELIVNFLSLSRS